MSDGCLITYKSSKPRDITKLNYHLFGRICHVKRNRYQKEKYYYSGILEKTRYVKIANGCYFVEDSDISEKIDSKYLGLLSIFPAIIEFGSVNWVTGKDYWDEKIDDTEFIHNWVKT